MEGRKMERVKQQQQSHTVGESEIMGRGEWHMGDEQATQNPNETQQKEEGESGDKAEKEQSNQQLTNKKRWGRGRESQ